MAMALPWWTIMFARIVPVAHICSLSSSTFLLARSGSDIVIWCSDQVVALFCSSISRIQSIWEQDTQRKCSPLFVKTVCGTGFDGTRDRDKEGSLRHRYFISATGCFVNWLNFMQSFSALLETYGVMWPVTLWLTCWENRFEREGTDIAWFVQRGRSI